MSAKSIGAAVGFALAPFNLITTGAGAILGKNVDDAKAARKAQEGLENQRRQELKTEADAREAAKQKAATSGQRAGKKPLGVGRSSFMTGLGFGSGTNKPGIGLGTLFGN